MEKEIQETQKFSVAMCLYQGDRADWFSSAVDSILNQTLKPNEVVLVVDGPIPQELESVVAEYEKLDIFKVVRLEVNQGHGNARRIGLQNCTYELIALMDADDISIPNRFEKQIRYLQKNIDVDIVGGNIAEFINEPKNIVAYRNVYPKDEDIKHHLRNRCPMNLVTVMFKKTSIQSVGGFMDWYCEEDYYLWIRMYLAKMKFANINDVLVNVRVGEEMYRRRGGWRYFRSEAKLQKYMYKNKIITWGTYIANITKRFIVQVLLPNRIRGWVFKKFARKSTIG